MTAKQKQSESRQSMAECNPKALGLHGLIEVRGDISHLDCRHLERLLRQMAAAAGATVLGANFHDFGTGLGKTGVVMLAESHISVHTWPEYAYAAIDIFVCGDASKANMEPVEAAIDVLRSADGHGCLTFQILERAVPQSSRMRRFGAVKQNSVDSVARCDLIEDHYSF